MPRTNPGQSQSWFAACVAASGNLIESVIQESVIQSRHICTTYPTPMTVKRTTTGHLEASIPGLFSDTVNIVTQ